MKVAYSADNCSAAEPLGANYRASCRARSRAESIAKISITLEEADEAAYWLELMIEAKMLPAERLQPLLGEANELTAILNRSRHSANNNG
ncbi:MAG: four helix bundle protein [Phycisphaeraceae bacterium]